MASGRYKLYTCDQIAGTINGTRARQIELEQLMARASQGAGGAFINAIAYRSEHRQNLDMLIELKREAEAKHCVTESKFSSGRAVF